MDVHNVLPETLQRRLEKVTLDQSLQSMKDYRNCPRPNCPGGSLFQANDTFALCGVCKLPFCPQCQEVNHPNQTCEEAQQQRLEESDEERSTAELKNQISKKCPNCQSFIMKDGGCDHVHCEKCGFHFCWICLEQYYIGHLRDFHPRARAPRPMTEEQHRELEALLQAQRAMVPPNQSGPITVERVPTAEGQEMTRITVPRNLRGRYFLVPQHVIEKVTRERRAFSNQLRLLGVEPNITPPVVL